MSLHSISARECVDLINSDNRAVLDAADAAAQPISALIQAAEPRFAANGRLIYIGAGTSGRLGVLDASEAPPTFQVEPGRVIGIIAGGIPALTESSETLEDDPAGATDELTSLNLTQNDTIIAIAAGGTTPFAVGGLEVAKRLAPACLTALICCAQIERPANADHLITLKTGPEIITGSTRMKAGTATKIAINTISTTLMVRTGRVYQNLMVDLSATNAKLTDRAARIIAQLTDLDRPACFGLLECAGHSVKHAIVMHKLGVDQTQADQMLRAANGKLGPVIDP